MAHSNADCSVFTTSWDSCWRQCIRCISFQLTQLNNLPVTAVELAHTDPILSQVYHYTQRSWPGKVSPDFQLFLTSKEEFTVERGCVLWSARSEL